MVSPFVGLAASGPTSYPITLSDKTHPYTKNLQGSDIWTLVKKIILFVVEEVRFYLLDGGAHIKKQFDRDCVALIKLEGEPTTFHECKKIVKKTFGYWTDRGAIALLENFDQNAVLFLAEEVILAVLDSGYRGYADPKNQQVDLRDGGKKAYLKTAQILFKDDPEQPEVKITAELFIDLVAKEALLIRSVEEIDEIPLLVEVPATPPFPPSIREGFGATLWWLVSGGFWTGSSAPDAG